MKKQIRIKLLPNGQIHAETIGMKGKECLSHIKNLEKLVAGTVVKTDLTADYYQEETSIEQVNKLTEQN